MFQEAYMRKIAALVGLAAVVALLAYTYYAMTQARYVSHMPVTISVAGEGEIFAKPDVATFNFSVNAKEKEASMAQSKSADAINAIIAYLKDNGVEEKDIRTQYYNLSPQYEYPQTVCNSLGYCPPRGEPKVVGYEVTQSVEVKVRTIDDTSKLIGGVGELGATNLDGPSFTIDDESALQAQAREKAIIDAKTKAEKLAKDLGVRIVRMNGFWEEQGGYPMLYGKGGDASAITMSAEMAVAPEIPTGENSIISRVNISYEVR